MRTHHEPVRIALVGAGLIGRRHANAIAFTREATLAAVVEPAPIGEEIAKTHEARWFTSIDDAIDSGGVDAVILATPSSLHVEGALAAISAGLPVLVEKPIATTVRDAVRMVDAAERAAVPLAVGHHRRHNPILAAARERIESGALGQLVVAHAAAWLGKPDDYFAPEWRRLPGAGPLLTNLIHDIDALNFLCGPVVEVSGAVSSNTRGRFVEDTAVATLRFENGALGTLTVSDTTVAPWSWELTARENPAYPSTNESSMWVAGTLGSLSIPDGRIWTQHGARDWWSPITATHMPIDQADPLVRQIEQFAAVVRGTEAPVASGRDGLLALAVVEAIKQAAKTGRTIALADLLAPDPTKEQT